MMWGFLNLGRNLDQEKQNKTYEEDQNKKINNDENKKNPESPKSEDKIQEEMIKILVEEVKNLRIELKEKNDLINQMNLNLPTQEELELDACKKQLNQTKQHFSENLKLVNTNSFTQLSKKDKDIKSVQEIKFSIVPKQDKNSCILF